MMATLRVVTAVTVTAQKKMDGLALELHQLAHPTAETRRLLAVRHVTTVTPRTVMDVTAIARKRTDGTATTQKATLPAKKFAVMA